ncbi:glucose/quinate/shikimate family membrane-bound PQQ-dependent dehydrogenase [Pusillimonas sp. MFBS29]|uniref:glucose/quinate/shikimate family membrane-bound PQQ-dependent dehydrogenase n=1 Tax=Pusillimonas sp. MFBS29 TaxID=2886690 RepID=UPI001D0FB0C5|nr:glucose/quinate/shikimate family membrane-bound PQQ-dependent dehydrogenase [Pusillimonas sp. MFBS29]MCC2595237.1 glucose/quinate/shikimate family membrane-bound PQQ-dependent dehydrogenase [Pusillimonas sp. MFBS29]
MRSTQRNTALLVAAWLNALFGVVLTVGGLWLIAAGGSWYYALAGVALLFTAVLLFRREVFALWLYALLVFGTVLWALWEVGLDWWPLAARGDVLFLLGLFMLTPWVTRPLRRRARTASSTGAPRWIGMPLMLSLLVFLGVGVASWFVDPHRIEGELPAARAQLAGDAQQVPPGEWHAYGRGNHGQRYSPLAQITPQNVSRLEVAWHYETGDMRGRAGDPVETTFEVTPLKIGERLYLCTPHQSVVALDATTGEEIWRYDPQIRDELALQHLTCRGLSYYDPAKVAPLGEGHTDPGQGSADAAVPESRAADVAGADRERTAAAALLQALKLPVAAQDKTTIDQCTAKLFMPTADGRIIALDPDDGAVCTNFGGGSGQINLWANMPFARPGGYYSTSPVVVTQSLIIVGGTVLDNVSTEEPSGVIRAYDVNTGELVWNWDPGNPDSTEPLEPGQTYTPSVPNSWSISSVDESLGMVYVPMGNQPPDQWGGERNAAAAPYGSAVVALDLKTGQVRWHFQTVHHDLWDYDVPAQPSLIDLTIGEQTIPALVQPTKQGELFVLDRRNGEPILPVTEQPYPQGAAQGDRTAPTQPVSALSFDPAPLTGASMWGATLFDQLACRIAFHQLRYEGRYTPPSTEGTLVYPGNFGVFNWGGIAVDPERQIAFVTPTQLAFVSRLIPREDDTTLYVQGGERPQDSLPALNENFGAPFAVQLSAFTSVLGLPCQAPPWGYVAGADLTTGKVAWMHKNGTVRDSSPVPLPFRMGVPNLGGPIVTAGGVAFLSSTLDYYLRAYDVTTGDELWKGRLPAGGQATPMTYTGSDGRQYVVAVAGGHGSLGTKAGDDVIAYVLPEE